MPQRSAFIPDGYTEPGYIAAQENMWEPLRFTYRPMRIDERSRVFGNEITSASAAIQNQATAQSLKRNIVSWDVQDAKGAPVEITEANLLLIRPALFDKLLNIVSGYKPSDTDPSWTKSQVDHIALEAMRAMEAKRPIGDVRAEADEKNSAAA